jgi:hypothetical protein
MNNQSRSSFEEAARRNREASTIGELWQFLANRKRWWMVPIVVVLLMFGVLVFLSGTAAAPFIYTLF